jgi:hypothetical protein
MRRVVGMSVVVALLATGSLRAQSGSSLPSKSSTADYFTVLDVEAQRGRPATVDELTQQLTTWGFKRTADSGSSGSWEKSDSEGVLRATAFFLPDEVSIWLFFFPARRVPMADAILNQLMRNADYSAIEDGGVEIAFKTMSLSVDGKTGTRAEFALIVGSTVTRRRVVVKWKR